MLHQQGAGQSGPHVVCEAAVTNYWCNQCEVVLACLLTPLWTESASSLITPQHKPIAENMLWPSQELHLSVHQLHISQASSHPHYVQSSLLARITASWDTQDSEEQDETLTAGDQKEEEGNTMHTHAAMWS